jgi:hypothetical protein
VQLVGRAPIAGEEQEPESDLRDEQRLRERERVRHELSGAPATPVDDAAEEGRQRRYADDEVGEDGVRVEHRREATAARPPLHLAPLGSAKRAEEAHMVEEGKPAPDFELTSDSGERVRLSTLRGQPVVLYFYPKDDSLASYDSNRS